MSSSRLIRYSFLLLVVIICGAAGIIVQARQKNHNQTPPVSIGDNGQTNEQPTLTKPDNSLTTDPNYPKAVPKLSAVPNQVTEYVATLTNDNPKKKQLQQIAEQPIAVWLTGDRQVDSSKLDQVIITTKQDEVASLVIYNITYRNCQASSGATNNQDYIDWLDSLIPQIAQLKQPIVIVEPDALALIDCLSDESARKLRIDLINQTINKLKSQSTAQIFLDAGHANWVPADKMASLINRTDYSSISGLSLNISNYQSTKDSMNYGRELIKRLNPNLKLIIDTSRNGNGPAKDNQWCNPSGRALGETPRIIDIDNLYGLLWVKVPGESDGSCNGGPSEGTFWEDYALKLITNRI